MNRSSGGGVVTGLEALVRQDFAPLKGQRIGLVTNQTGILRDSRTAIDVLAEAPGVRLRALFGPEHGVRGDVPAGKYVASSRDAKTGLPVYSLYGRTYTPTAAMLKGLDLLVFDIQDIGSRSYTYISTLGHVMEGAARHKAPLVVLDRPNPLGGEQIEGSPTASGFRSFIGRYPIAYRHGLTMGELARMINGRGWLPGDLTCDLTVARLENWRRPTISWAETGLPWVRTSPHVPRADTPLFYAATGIVGELSTLSIGIGYQAPFEVAGAPGLDADSFVREMARRRDLPGTAFRPAAWTPAYGVHSGRRCTGLRLAFPDPARAPLTRLNFDLMDAVRRLEPGRSFFASSSKTKMFDLACGTDRIRKAFQAGASAARLWELWNEGRDAFRAARKPYLLY